MYAQPVQPQVAPVQPAMPQQPVYAPPPAAAPPAAPKKKSACFTTCCVGSVILGLLAVIAGILAYVYVLPRVQAQTYVTQVRPLHAAAIAKIEALQDDPAIKKLNSVTINDSNFGSTTKTMIDLAAVCTDARHSADAVADKLGKIQAPPNLKELHAALIDYYTSVTTSLNEIEPQVDYMALVLDAWQRSIKGLSEAQSGSSSNLDQIATQLDTLRGKLKETHDTLMVKSAPPGSEDLHKAMLKSLEELSDLLSQMSSALRNRQLSQLVSLARSAESRANGAAKRLETGFTAWGTKMSSKFDTLSATLTEKENQVNLRVKAVNEKLKLTGDQALPLFKEEAKK